MKGLKQANKRWEEKKLKKALNNELKAAKNTEKRCSVLTAKTVSELIRLGDSLTKKST